MLNNAIFDTFNSQMKFFLSYLIFFLIGLFLFNNAILAQNSKFDSLKTAIARMPEDTAKVNALLDLANDLRNSNPGDALEIANSALEMADDLNFIKGRARTYNLLGLISDKKAEYQNAIDFFNKALATYQEIDDQVGIAKVYNNMGITYSNQAQFQQAIEYYLQSLKIHEKLNNLQEMSYLYNNIGIIYFTQSDTAKTLEYFFKDLKIVEKLGDKKGIADSYSNIGVIYHEYGKFEKAIEYQLKSLKIREELRDVQGLSTSYYNIANIYQSKNDFRNASKYYQQAYEKQQMMGDIRGMATTLNALGYISQKQKKIDEAIKYYNKSIRIYNEIGVIEGKKDVMLNLSLLYSEMGNFQKAYEYHIRYVNIKDSLTSQESKKIIAELQTKYETEKNIQKIELLNRENEIKDARVQRQRILSLTFIIGFCMILVFSLVTLRMYNQKKAANILLAQQKEEITTQRDEITKQKEHLEILNYELAEQKEEITVQRDKIEIQNKNLQEANHIIEHKNKHITDSIKYAQKIQQAILPLDSHLDQLLPEYFVLYKPKDIVSGDFYWVDAVKDSIIFSAVDCTGHGVPGAFMSIVGHNLLKQAVIENQITKPSEILNYLSKKINATLKQSDKEKGVKDGMDLAICNLNLKKKQLQFAGAYNPMYLLRNNEIQIFNADKYPIGAAFSDDFKSYTNHEIALQTGDMVYVFSDGFVDQFGGPKKKKFMNKQLREVLLEIQHFPMPEQKNMLLAVFENWKGTDEQIDDVLIMGIRIA